ncbi:MAG: DUF2877 domain-containing protein [Burkholderiales bacterium]
MADALAPCPATIRATWVGESAAAALDRSCGRFTRLDAAGGGNWVQAAETLLWMGEYGPLHPRAVLVECGSLGRIDLSGARLWRAPKAASPPHGCAHDVIAECLGALGDHLAKRAPDRGFAPLLAGRTPAFPLAARMQSARDAMHAARNNAPAIFLPHALRLIGVGSGLTPSGDDLLGGALFAIHSRYPGCAAWSACATSICAAAAGRTHPVSLALLADHARGKSFAAMHELLNRAAAAESQERLVESANEVATIGNTSGWDMLTGLILASALPQT